MIIIVFKSKFNFEFNVTFLRIKTIIYLTKSETYSLKDISGIEYKSKFFGYMGCRRISPSRLFCLGIHKLGRLP